MPIFKFTGGGTAPVTTQDLNGNNAAETSFTLTADGGSASTATFVIDYNGSNAAFA